MAALRERFITRQWLAAVAVAAALLSSGSASAASGFPSPLALQPDATSDKPLIDGAPRGRRLVPAAALETSRATKTEPVGKATVSPPVRSRFDRIELQDFIRASIGRDLPLYGYDLFEDIPETLAPLANVPVPAAYVIVPGDEITGNRFDLCHAQSVATYRAFSPTYRNG